MPNGGWGLATEFLEPANTGCRQQCDISVEFRLQTQAVVIQCDISVEFRQFHRLLLSDEKPKHAT